MTDKTLTLLGFASKAGKLSYGFNKAVGCAKNGKAKLLICAFDISDKSKKELTFYSQKYNLPFWVLDTDSQTLSSAIGNRCGVVSVNDTGFCKSIIAQEEKR